MTPQQVREASKLLEEGYAPSVVAQRLSIATDDADMRSLMAHFGLIPIVRITREQAAELYPVHQKRKQGRPSSAGRCPLCGASPSNQCKPVT